MTPRNSCVKLQLLIQLSCLAITLNHCLLNHVFLNKPKLTGLYNVLNYKNDLQARFLVLKSSWKPSCFTESPPIKFDVVIFFYCIAVFFVPNMFYMVFFNMGPIKSHFNCGGPKIHLKNGCIHSTCWLSSVWKSVLR